MNKRIIRKILQYLLLLVSVLLIVSGYGITKSKIVEPATLGILDKPASFQLHELLIWSFVILLILHVFLAIKRK